MCLPSFRSYLVRQVFLTLLCSVIVVPGFAQIQMPDPKEMSGLPLPSGELDLGTISVRLIRGQLSNNLVGHSVQLLKGNETLTEVTDENGRAYFKGLVSGEAVIAVATVDGERIESRKFTVPNQGGIRVMLVATKRGDSADVKAGIQRNGEVSFGGETRIHIEFEDDAVQIYYLLEIVNPQRTPVMPPATLVLDMPTGARGTALIAGSSREANIRNNRVTIPGPFQPGRTPLYVGYAMPLESETISLTQEFPVSLTQVAVVVQKLGEVRLSSAQFTEKRELAPDGAPFILGRGPGLAAGESLVFELQRLPHHSLVPRYTALSIAIAIVGIGILASFRRRNESAEVRYGKLVAKKSRLLAELVRFEERKNSGKIRSRDEVRRRELTAELVRVYTVLGEELSEVAVDLSVSNSVKTA